MQRIHFDSIAKKRKNLITNTCIRILSAFKARHVSRRWSWRTHSSARRRRPHAQNGSKTPDQQFYDLESTQKKEIGGGGKNNKKAA